MRRCAWGICQAAALVDETGARIPVQQTAQGAVARLRGLPSKGWRTYGLSAEPAEVTTPFAQAGNRLETPYYVVELDESGLFSRLYDKTYQREVLKPGEAGQPPARV